ncbi:peptidase inhibitor family I36 protein [Nonomuraea antimicrobica]
MTWKRKTATAASALLFAAGGMLVTAPPSAAALSCPVNRLCIYDKPNFGGNRIASGSTNACFSLRDFEFTFGTIVSYDNNLSVDAIVWRYMGFGTPKPYQAARTLVAGKFSSNIGVPGLGGDADKVCMGSARP